MRLGVRMYCPKCNLQAEKDGDKCPLCNGPMEVDETAGGVTKTPSIPDKEDRADDLPRGGALSGRQK